MILKSFIRLIISVGVLLSIMLAGTEDGTSNIYVVTQGSNLKQNYFNENATGVRIYFTVDEAFNTLFAYAELKNSADIGDCTETSFNAASGMELGAGNGASIAGIGWSPAGGFVSGTTYYLDLYYSDIYAHIVILSQKETDCM